MTLGSTGAADTAIGPIRRCLFLDLLPLEIRREIYRYLLTSRYIKRELHMTSSEYDARRDRILEGPDHSYDFHPSILGAKQQIRAEALDVFERENLFIAITTETPYNYWPESFPSNVDVLATGDLARAFPNIAMDITFKVGNLPGSGDPKKRATSVITLEDLPSACADLQKMIKEFVRVSRAVDILVTVSNHISGSKASILLDPLRELNGAAFVEIDGPGCPSLKDSTIAAMSLRPFSANEAMVLVGALMDQGDKAKGKPELAIAKYKAALDTIRGNPFNEHENSELLVGGRFNGLRADLTREDTIVWLHSSIAAGYLNSGNSRLARVYVERIYGPLHSYDHRFNKQKFPLELPANHNPEVYAEILAVASKISTLHGKHQEARQELSEAMNLDPANKDAQRLMEECQATCDERYYRRARQNKARDDIAERKFRASLQVATARTTKGDAAFRATNFKSARSKYEAAYSKAQACHDGLYYPLWIYPYEPALKELKIDILTKLAQTCLELSDFQNTHRWADALLALEPDFLSDYTYPHYRDGVAYAADAFHVAYYCKAVAYQKEGGPNAGYLAMRSFERALVCDGGCHAAYYQLEALREVQEAKKVVREARDEKLREEQELVRRQHEKKVRKKVAREAKSRAKKARGSGYLIGVGSDW